MKENRKKRRGNQKKKEILTREVKGREKIIQLD